MSTWYERGVFYHMYPLGMTGAPKHNDATKVTNRLRELDKWILHIRFLGCSAIYMGPVFESVSHGYDTRDYRLVDRRLGDNDPLRNSVVQCHQEGTKVTVDGVLNHMRCEFFTLKDIQEKRRDPPYKDWYRGVNFGQQSLYGDSFGYEVWQGYFELPCLSLFNPDVRSYLFDAIRLWIGELDVDGVRLDCANVLDFNFIKEMCSRTETMKEDFRLTGKAIHGDYSRWVNNEMLHFVTNYELHKSLYSGSNDHNFFEIAHNVRRLEAIGCQFYIFVDNHDGGRIATKLNPREHLFPIYFCLFTLPGIPSVYYGGEWSIEGKRTNTSDEVLRPAISTDQEGELYCELTDLIAQLGQIHRRQEALHMGRYQELLLANRQYAFARHDEDSVITVAVSNDGEPASLSIPVPIQVSKAVNLLEPGDRLPILDEKIYIKLKGNRGAVLKLKGEN